MAAAVAIGMLMLTMVGGNELQKSDFDHVCEDLDPQPNLAIECQVDIVKRQTESQATVTCSYHVDVKDCYWTFGLKYSSLEGSKLADSNVLCPLNFQICHYTSNSKSLLSPGSSKKRIII